MMGWQPLSDIDRMALEKSKNRFGLYSFIAGLTCLYLFLLFIFYIFCEVA